MLNTDIKKQINTARDILVGKIPDPKGQIDQITNALIYKFMDDQDRLAETLPGGKASFFVNGLAPYAWHKLFDSKLSNQDRANLYVEGIEKLSKAKHLPELFQDIFKDAFLPFRASDTIAMFLNEINKFDYHHSEDLGNAFEYLLSIMGSQGDAGQFRTPRNIIEFIVDAVDPQKDETILDPACGTAGFLVEAYKHITEKEDLSQSDIQKLGKNITGIDIDPGMAKIARVNLYLHGFKTPQISEDDSLSNENTWGKKYDVILANPPFMTPKGGIKPHDKFTIQSKRAEVLFTDYIAEHLKLAGRAGIVVPEGIIFQGSNTYKQLRKMLIDDGYLWGVISLPAGVFNPYSGVKTSILLLDRQRASEVDEIMFYKVDNDGFDLGSQRRPIKDNDLPEALEVINAWRDGKKLEKEKALFVSKEKLAENGDYNLSIDRYRVVADYTNIRWPIIKLEDICDIGDGNHSSKYPRSKEMVASGVPFIRGVNLRKGTISNKEMKYISSEKHLELKKGHLKTGDVLFTNRGQIGKVAIIPARFNNSNLNSQIAWLRPKEGLISKYLFFILNSSIVQDNLPTEGATLSQFTIKQLRKLEIPLPPLEVQEQIVAELDGYQAIIDGAQKVVDNWKPKIEIDPEWEKVKLGDLYQMQNGRAFKKTEWSNEGLPIIRIANLNSEDASFNYFEGEFDKKILVEKGDLLFSWSGTRGTSFGPHIWDKESGLLNQHIFKMNLLEDVEVDVYFAYISLLNILKDIESEAHGAGGLVHITKTKLSDFEIQLPSVEIQKEIVKKIAREQGLVESTKQLIKIHEDKIKKVVDGLWGE